MKASRVLIVLMVTLGLTVPLESFANPQRDAILAELLTLARKDDPGFAGFSAERGATFYRAKHADGNTCTSCHGNSPLEKGQTRAGKVIEPMAVSKNPARFTNKDDVEKWFTRNCNNVVGRACTAREKGDFITFMMEQ